jgi:hypothetical protein
MKYLKFFEGYKEDIHSICKKYHITDYTINDDGSIDVYGDVHLSNRRLTKLPLKFKNVHGDFHCDYNQLTSLEGSPESVEYFYCYNNQLTSLEGAPRSVSGDFYCSNNQLTSLEGAPSHVGGGFYCYNNQLTSLEGSPQSVDGDFYCNKNKLTSLEGGPRSVGGEYNFDKNPCNPIYQDWINVDRRSDLLEMMEDYDFLRGSEIVWDRLESFFNDNDLELPNKEELRKNYKII